MDCEEFTAAFKNSARCFQPRSHRPPWKCIHSHPHTSLRGESEATDAAILSPPAPRACVVTRTYPPPPAKNHCAYPQVAIAPSSRSCYSAPAAGAAFRCFDSNESIKSIKTPCVAAAYSHAKPDDRTRTTADPRDCRARKARPANGFRHRGR